MYIEQTIGFLVEVEMWKLFFHSSREKTVHGKSDNKNSIQDVNKNLNNSEIRRKYPART